MRRINLIVLHHSASPAGATTNEIRKWHLEKGWSDIGYHYIVEEDGLVVKGREDDIVGAHCLGFNAHSLGICVVGNFSPDDEHEPTDAQVVSVNELIKRLMTQYVSIERYVPHKELSFTMCPGRLMEWIHYGNS